MCKAACRCQDWEWGRSEWTIDLTHTRLTASAHGKALRILNIIVDVVEAAVGRRVCPSH